VSASASVDPAAQLALRLALAALLAAAAAHKLRDGAGFRAVLRDYAILPDGLVGAASSSVPAAEAAIALGLLLSATRVAASLAAASLLSLYGVAIAINLARGRRAIDCGCAGPGGPRPLSGGLVARNAALAAAALACATPVAARPLGWIDAGTVVGALLAGVLIYAAADVALANAARPRAAGVGGPWTR
jgi:Methylamine utilisation protein MauE